MNYKQKEQTKMIEWLKGNDRSLRNSIDDLNRIKRKIGKNGEYEREVSLAIDRLEECEMWINKVINKMTAPKQVKK